MFRITRQVRQVACAGNRARVCLPAFLLLVSLGAARADQVAVGVQESRGGYSVRGELVTSAPPSVAWDVLTDYDHINTFVGAMRASIAERQPDGRVIVHQAARAGFFLVRKTVQVVLEVREDAGHKIVFRDLLGKDFRSYAGEWEIVESSNGTHVFYRLDADPKTMIPFAGRGVMSRSAHDLLSEVGAEMARRSDLQDHEPLRAPISLQKPPRESSRPDDLSPERTEGRDVSVDGS